MLPMDSNLAYELAKHETAERAGQARRAATARQMRQRRYTARVRVAGWLHQLADQLEPRPRSSSSATAAAK